jgi:periplasmic copper chaperone A
MMTDERNPSLAGSFAAAFIAYCIFLGTANGAADISPPVSVSNAWIRWLPADLPAAGYATLRNASDRRATLIEISTPDYGSTMFHASRNIRGVEQMVPVDSVPIEPHSQVSFAPEGLHIMLMQPRRAIQPGDHVLLTLHFAEGQSLPVQFEVRRPDGSALARANAASAR